MNQARCIQRALGLALYLASENRYDDDTKKRVGYLMKLTCFVLLLAAAYTLPTAALAAAAPMPNSAPNSAPNPAEAKALHSFSQELTSCSIVFDVIKGCLNKMNKADVAKGYEQNASALLKAAYETARAAGETDAEIVARYKHETETMTNSIHNNCMDISPLMNTYLQPCTAVIKNPGQRLQYWESQTAE